jgi:hypothetical protein
MIGRPSFAQRSATERVEKQCSFWSGAIAVQKTDSHCVGIVGTSFLGIENDHHVPQVNLTVKI